MDITVTVPDAVVPRIRAAFGTTTGGPATVNEVRNAIKAYLKSRVIDYETTLAAITHRDSLSGEVW